MSLSLLNVLFTSSLDITHYLGNAKLSLSPDLWLNHLCCHLCVRQLCVSKRFTVDSIKFAACDKTHHNDGVMVSYRWLLTPVTMTTTIISLSYSDGNQESCCIFSNYESTSLLFVFKVATLLLKDIQKK